jgi:hypothetical protein
MELQGAGDWLLCTGYGHLALTSSRLFQRTCSKCVVLDRRVSNAVFKSFGSACIVTNLRFCQLGLVGK